MPENNNKDPIEHLFRKKAEEYDISYQEADWMKLEKRLDEQQRQLAARRKRWLVAAALLFLFSLLGYAVFQNYQEINKLNEQLDNQSIAETPRDDNTAESGDRDSDTADENRSEQPSETLDQPVTEEGPPSFASEREQTQSLEGEEQSVSQTFLVSDAMAQQLAVEELPQTPGDISEFAANQKQTDFNLVQPNDPYPHFMAAQQESTDASGVSEDPLHQPIAASRVSVGFLAGPDLSTVGGLSNFDQPGYNLGLLIEYRLSSNLSIRSGLMRASVNYKAGGDEYRPPSGFWSYDTAPPYQASAQCIILDIPVSLKYDFWHFERSKLYATVGASSYIMLNEEYQFDYESYNNNQVQEWSDRTGTRHWLSNANLSIGYAFDLNPHLSMQIEPFLKLPMREVGWGNVKLYSIGTSISFNYNLY